MSSGGVRRWKSVWLGITNARFAHAHAERRSPIASRQVPGEGERATASARRDVADDHHLPEREPAPDQPDDEPADEVARADRALEEAVRLLSAIATSSAGPMRRSGPRRTPGSAPAGSRACTGRPWPGACSPAAPSRRAGTASPPESRATSCRNDPIEPLRPSPTATRATGATEIEAISSADAMYVTRSTQNASGSCDPEQRHEQAGDHVADDVRERLADPQRRVRRHEVVLRDDPRQDRALRRPEEDRDRRDEEDERVGEREVRHRRERDQQHEPGPQQVADDHHLAVVPAVDEAAGDRPEQQVRQRRDEEHRADGDRGVGRVEHDERQRDLVDPVAERADELAGPQGAERAVEGEADVRVAPDPLEDRRDAGIGTRRSGPRPSAPSAASRRAICGRSRAGGADERRHPASRDARRPRRAPAAPRRSTASSGGATSSPSRRRTASSAAALVLDRVRTVTANRKNPRPAPRNRSPMLMTLRMNGIGIGMMSPSGPGLGQEVARDAAAVAVAPTILWNVARPRPAVSPAATMLGSQTGMYPPLATIATAFSRMPDEGERQARLLAVDPQPDQQEQEPEARTAAGGGRSPGAMPLSIANCVVYRTTSPRNSSCTQPQPHGARDSGCCPPASDAEREPDDEADQQHRRHRSTTATFRHASILPLRRGALRRTSVESGVALRPVTRGVRVAGEDGVARARWPPATSP